MSHYQNWSKLFGDSRANNSRKRGGSFIKTGKCSSQNLGLEYSKAYPQTDAPPVFPRKRSVSFSLGPTSPQMRPQGIGPMSVAVLGTPRSHINSPVYQDEDVKHLYFRSTSHALFDFLMPNGIVIRHTVSTTAPMVELKAELWELASRYPLYGTLHDLTSYHFTYVGLRAGMVEVMDESKCLLDINPFVNILRFIERRGNEAEKALNMQIGFLIGKSLNQFDALKNPEVNDFRWQMRVTCDEIVSTRNNQSWEKQVQYHYPCRLQAVNLPAYVQDKLKETNGHIYFTVQFSTSKSFQSKFTICVQAEACPSEVLQMALNKSFSTVSTDKQNPENEFILKVPGREEYLVEEVSIVQYTTVREHISQEGIQQPIPLIAAPRTSVDVKMDVSERVEDVDAKVRNSFSAMTMNKKKNVNFLSSWTVSEYFKITVGTLSKLNLDADEQAEVMLEAGLYHGSKALCENIQTRELKVTDGKAKIDEMHEFSIPVGHIPRSARLCFGIYQVTQNQKLKGKPSNVAIGQNVSKNPIAWVNTPVFDYRSHLKDGAMTLYAWSTCEGQVDDIDLMMEVPNPLGTVVSNPDHDCAVTLTITFNKYHSTDTIMYPSKDKIIAFGKEHLSTDVMAPTEATEFEVQQIAARDPLTDLHEQERKKLWSLRNYCKDFVPQVLPKVLQCVEWDDTHEVAQVYALLENWPKLEPNQALELLDYAYPESVVRKYAVDCLYNISDDDLLLYLLQLVQALKHENYLYCHLVEFLLDRALRNMRIGHFFFWHLRSEMHVPAVAIKFGLILEAYCRGSVEHMKLLSKQLDAINKFKDLQTIVREYRVREKAAALLRENMKKEQVMSSLSNFLNPIDPMYRISSVKVDMCKSMDSKMVPLWLVFENDDPDGKDIYLLYKSGDDLRQDMLALQMIKIMDKLWKENGLDLRMNPYTCMSTDKDEGIIQIVTDAQTVANIQREKGMARATCAFQKQCLLEWLKEHNTSENELNKAVDEFTLSCAGYCVATYVLGVGDRHSDNIMIMRNGQLFHIDFGHILGHFKHKFGIKRERQPFVLTHDFIYVITRGRQTRSEDFARFKKYCEEAFRLLRKNGSFIISLFAMMISTGLPELQGERDLNHLKETLKLDVSEEEALEHFRAKFHEALNNAWKTNLNWMFHSMAKNNR